MSKNLTSTNTGEKSIGIKAVTEIGIISVSHKKIISNTILITIFGHMKDLDLNLKYQKINK